MLVDLYATGDRTFQADFETPEGPLSFEFGPPISSGSAARVLGYWPKTPETKARAHDAFLSAMLSRI
ncbi:MAG: hypothetical protein INH43_27330 [Acidobacteriaceae bacterium]|nr:hypothetical protein [Acidobacteriaceae bacterium]